MRNSKSIRQIVRALGALIAMWAGAMALPSVASAQRVLVYGSGGVAANGFFPAGATVTVANDVMWRSMTAAQFGAFDVIWFDSLSCNAGPNTFLQAAVDTQAVWGPVVASGRAVYSTADHSLHAPSNPSAARVISNSVTWLGGLGATAEGGKTGVFFTWGCFMVSAGTYTTASLNTVFPGITNNFNNVESNLGVVPTHPTLTGTTTAGLQYANFCHGVITAQPAEWTSLVTCAGGGQGFMVREAACTGAPPAAGLSVNEGASTTLSLSGVAAGSTVTWDLDNNGSYETAGPTATFSGVGRDGPSSVTVGYSIAGTCRTTTGTARVVVNNVAPTVTSTAPTTGAPGVAVSYTATATDPANAADPLGWTLVSGPSGAMITSGGVFTWTPGSADVGTSVMVTIEVSDGDGGTTRQTFTIRVVECFTSAQCSGTTPVCNMTTNDCVACIDDMAGTMIDTGCGNGAPLCDVSAAAGPTCVACLSAADCADTNVCTTEACVSNACEITGVAPGMMGMCMDALVCSGPMGTTPNTCVQCTTNAQCSGATAFCDTATNVCGPCTADFGGTGAACAEATPYCALAGAMMGICGRCTSNTDCVGHAGAICDLTSGSCGSACNVDADCGDGQWCPDSRVCTPKVPNGMSVPAAGPANGMCSPTIGTRTCISGVCFEADDLCGLPNGEPCMGEGACRSTICAPNGECGECNSNDDCMGGRVCDVPTGACVTTDAGVGDAGAGDAGVGDAGNARFDAGGADGGPGGIAGGSCGCAVNTTKSNTGILAMLGMLALVVARTRRKR